MTKQGIGDLTKLQYDAPHLKNGKQLRNFNFSGRIGLGITKVEGTEYCQLPGGRGGKFKWPTLTELYTKLFGKAFDAAHNASADVEATTRAFLELIRLGIITPQRMGH